MCISRSEITPIHSFIHSFSVHGARALAVGSDARMRTGMVEAVTTEPARMGLDMNPGLETEGKQRQHGALGVPALQRPARQPVPTRDTAASTQSPGGQQAPSAVSRAIHA